MLESPTCQSHAQKQTGGAVAAIRQLALLAVQLAVQTWSSAQVSVSVFTTGTGALDQDRSGLTS